VKDSLGGLSVFVRCRWVVWLCVSFVLLTGACSQATTSTSHEATCRTSDLRLTYVAQSRDRSGHFVWVYGFENVGATPCSMSGYPSLAVQEASGAPAPIAAQHPAQWNSVTTVSLDPGKTAGFWFSLGRPHCARSSTILVTPPGASGALPAPSGGYLKLLCDGATGFLSPVQPNTAPPTQ
jgi:hypothetical protein